MKKKKAKSRANPRKRITAKKVQATEKKPVVPNVTLGIEPDEEDGIGLDGLTHRQRAFVLCYMGVAGMKATKAAELAGYRSENRNALGVTAHQVLRNPNVQRAIEQEFGKRFGTADDVRAGIAALARSNAADYLKAGEDGKLHVSLEAMAEAGALGSINQIHEERIEAGGSVTTIKLKLKLYDRLRALELIAKMNGQLIERKDITSGNKPLKGYLDIDDDDRGTDTGSSGGVQAVSAEGSG